MGQFVHNPIITKNCLVVELKCVESGDLIHQRQGDICKFKEFCNLSHLGVIAGRVEFEVCHDRAASKTIILIKSDCWSFIKVWRVAGAPESPDDISV
eukprot:SAG31_NODE_154_length_22184_cov_25.917142_15_plen_97_part_00